KELTDLAENLCFAKLRKAFSLFMFKLYNQTNTKSTYFILFLFVFFVYKQKTNISLLVLITL
ncbi:hypothetical protein PCO13_10215, partial [Streptococcus suis]|nr:hypothetical protein [Streptococcus suis]